MFRHGRLLFGQFDNGLPRLVQVLYVSQTRTTQDIFRKFDRIPKLHHFILQQNSIPNGDRGRSLGFSSTCKPHKSYYEEAHIDFHIFNFSSTSFIWIESSTDLETVAKTTLLRLTL